MIILSIRTDKPEAEIGLYDDHHQIAYDTWLAHRQLGATIHARIAALLGRRGYTLQDMQGIVCFQGPGSFTGLRIGITVANALAYALHIPTIARSSSHWLEAGITALLGGEREPLPEPSYGTPAATPPLQK